MMVAVKRFRQFGLVLCAVLASSPAFAGTLTMPAPVAVIYPGQTIGPDALSDQEFEVNPSINLGLYARDDGQLVGKVAVNTLLPGRAVTLSAVRDPYLVRRGAAATIVFDAGGLRIQASGIALEPGGAGDLIRIRNADSGKIVSGTVLADGSVMVAGQ